MAHASEHMTSRISMASRPVPVVSITPLTDSVPGEQGGRHLKRNEVHHWLFSSLYIYTPMCTHIHAAVLMKTHRHVHGMYIRTYLPTFPRTIDLTY